MIRNIFVVCLLILGMVFISGCVLVYKEVVIPGKGILEGKITISPLCPVERYPPDPACQPTRETYDAWPLAVWSLDKKIKIAEIEPNLEGTYKIELDSGEYLVDFEKEQPRIGGNNLPVDITIKTGQTTQLDIDIDTGIR